jgi:disulfide bond formation protein DsbB
MTRKQLLLAPLFFALAFLIIGCGGGGSTTPTDTPPTAAPAGDAAAGETLFAQNCSACHGPDAKGLPGLGKDMTTSDFIHSQTDSELLAFIKTGRPTSDPANTTGVDMPPKGGNPALTDAQLLDIIAFIRTLNQ